MATIFKRIFTYIAPVWSGDDGKPSIRRILAIALCIDLIINIHNSVSVATKIINLIYQNKPIDSGVISAMSSNLAQITMILGIEASLIAAMLALTTWQGTKLPNSGQQS